jgi:quinol monooxygenase YgiN
MPSTIHIVARFRAKAGQEAALKDLLLSLVAPSRRELGCCQYDLLQSSTNPAEFCFVERWETEKALEQHGASAHVAKARARFADLIDGEPDRGRYVIV